MEVIKINYIAINDRIDLVPKIPKDNQIICPDCGGVGWFIGWYPEGLGIKYLQKCSHCHNGLIEICPYCNNQYNKTNQYYCRNKECEEKRSADEQLKIAEANAETDKWRFGKAIKYTYEEVPNESKIMLYSDHYPYNEGYFDNFDCFYNILKKYNVDIPKYVWGTYTIGMAMDARSVIEWSTDELWAGAADSIDDSDIEELQEYLDKWCAKQTGTTSYCMDYKCAILVPDEYLDEESD